MADPIDMTTEVVNGVIAAIKAAFPQSDVFENPVEQGIEENSFSVCCVKPAQEQFLGRRYFKSHLIEIVYFPPKGQEYTACYGIAEELFDALEIITAGNDPIRGKHFDSRYLEESRALVVTVVYDYYVIRQDDTAKMQTLHIEWKG